MLKYILLTIITLNLLKTSNTMLAGGFSQQHTNEKCEDTLKKILSEHSGFKGYEIKSCEEQIVNGVNYRMILENNDKIVKKCKITIWTSFDETRINPIRYREGKDDCFTMFDNAQESTTSV